MDGYALAWTKGCERVLWDMVSRRKRSRGVGP